MIIINWLPTPMGLTVQGQGALSILFLSVLWWITTPVALSTTAICALALLPLLNVARGIDIILALGNQTLFFLFAVFVIAAACTQNGLSKRVSLIGLRHFSSSAFMLCNGVLLLSWGLCTVIVSHAVCALMLPIVLGIIHLLGCREGDDMSKRLLLSMAWGSICGSNLSLLSSARASLSLSMLAGQVPDHGIGMLSYSMIAAPISLLSVTFVGLLLHWRYPCREISIQTVQENLCVQLEQCGNISSRERMTVLLLGGMILSILLVGVSSMGVIALLFSALFFVFGIMKWTDAKAHIHWGVIVLYGAAIVLGGVLYDTGAAMWMVENILILSDPVWMMLSLCFLVIVGTELISNAAVIAIVLPIALGCCTELGIAKETIAVLLPVCAGFAFVLPTSTPAMAMVFGARHVTVRDTAWGVILSIGMLVVMMLWVVCIG